MLSPRRRAATSGEYHFPTKPQVLFRGTRLIVGSAIAQFFTIDDIKVGRTSQFVATGSQPAEAFKDTATGDNVSLDTCRPGMDIVLQVTNVSDTFYIEIAHTFAPAGLLTFTAMTLSAPTVR